jgi:predicted RNase H-like HicB family nuclease
VTHRYLVVIEPAGRNYSAYSPDLPGCVATGATREETRTRMQQAIALHLEGLREDHQPIPEPAASAEVVEVAV